MIHCIQDSGQPKKQTNNKRRECAFFLRWHQTVFKPDPYLQTFRTFSLPQEFRKLTKMQLGQVGFLLLGWKMRWAFNLSSDADIISHCFSDNFFDKYLLSPFSPFWNSSLINIWPLGLIFPSPASHQLSPCFVTGEEFPIPDFDIQYFLFYYLVAALIF